MFITRKHSKRDDRGVALVVVLALIIVISVIAVIALKGSTLGLQYFGNRRIKTSTDLAARAALDVFEDRIRDRMNPRLIKANGDPRTLDDLQKMVPAFSDSNGINVGGQFWHGYRFQRGRNVKAELLNYMKDFVWESKQTPRVGVFEECSVANACATDGIEWSFTYEGADPPVPTSNKFDLRADDNSGAGIEDLVFELPVRVVARNVKTGKRTVIRTTFLVGASDPSTNGAFSILAQILSRFSLVSGRTKGPVGNYYDYAQARKVTLPSGDEVVPKGGLQVGALGMVDPTCHRNVDGLFSSVSSPCDNAMSAGLLISDIEREWDRTRFVPWHTNMRMDSWISARMNDIFLDQYGRSFIGGSAFALSNPHEGITIDDDANTPASPPFPAAPDFLPVPEKQVVDVFNRVTVPGRQVYGKMTELNRLSGILNGSGTAQITAQGGNCIYESAGSGTDSGLGTAKSSLTGGSVVPRSVVLAPQAGCDVRVEGTVIVNGDVIIAGDGAEQFIASEGSSILATGNVYILNNIFVNTSPAPEARGPSTDMDHYRKVDYPRWKPSQETSFDQLGIVAGGTVVIGNLANSQVFSHIMTYGNADLAYWNLDLDDDGEGDLFVPDGSRPTGSGSTPTRSPTDDIQILRNTCGDFNGHGMGINCGTQFQGILPEGSDLVTSKYKFFLGHGYSRNEDDQDTPDDFMMRNRDGTVPSTTWPFEGWPASYRSDVPVGGTDADRGRISDIFQNGWISTTKFREFAGAELGEPSGALEPVATRGWYAHDSLAPDYINRARHIAAKIYAPAIVGVGSFDDDYFLPPTGHNPDTPRRAAAWASPPANYEDFTNRASLQGRFPQLTKNVNDLNRYPNRCASPPPLRSAAAGAYPSYPNFADFPNYVPYAQLNGAAPELYDPAEYGNYQEAPWHSGKVNDGHPLPASGVEIFGGLYGKYVSVLSTNGLCVYQDDRAFNLGHEPIYVIRAPAQLEDQGD